MVLTQVRAQFRSEHIKKGSIFYDYHIIVEQGTHYLGLSELHFQLLKIPNQLPIDLQIQQIKKIVVNTQQIELKKEEGFILIDGDKLINGQNVVIIYYKNQYDNDGNGCISFTDVDGKQYVYTQFEPGFAKRVFPIFDQPDLKAKMRLSILSPKTWQKIISNQFPLLQLKQFNKEQYQNNIHTTNKQLLKQFLQGFDGNMTIFQQTKLLPSYLFAFVAGPYKQLKLQQTYNNIPMSLYCVESLYIHMEIMAPFLFEITLQSMKFYQFFFGHKYPFSKYDQIFAHEYKYAAMQNASCVTYDDNYVWRQKVSTQTMLNLAIILSHELSHHWFGNLVTMKWWDDLWLNESFAQFISHLCLQKIKQKCKTIQFQSAMASFINQKTWGYADDQMITTHPIRGTVLNAKAAQCIFDGITYSKGAACLKQLLYLMKQQNFSNALSVYFHKYQFSNSTLDELIAEMQKSFQLKQFTLSQWVKLWLQTASFNQIQPQWNPKDTSETAKLLIKMTPIKADYPTLRPHKIKIGFFKQDFTVDAFETLLYPKQYNQVTYNGSKGYKAILLNYEDHSFVKNNLDEISHQYFTQNLSKINDILSRTQIWKIFFQSLRDGKIHPKKYIDFVLKNVGSDQSDSLFQTQFQHLYTAISVYTPIPYRNAFADKVFQALLQFILNEQNENRIVIIKGQFPQFAFSDQKKKILIQWLQGKYEPLIKHPMTISQQWSAVVKAFTLNDLTLEQKETLFKNQQQKDNSDTAKLKRYTCDALKATKQQFLTIYQNLKSAQKCNEWSKTLKQAISQGWRTIYHLEWLVELKQTFFNDIPQVAKHLKDDHLQHFVTLKPVDDDLQGTIKGYQSIQLEGDKYAKIQSQMMEIIDSLKRIQKVYALFNEPI